MIEVSNTKGVESMGSRTRGRTRRLTAEQLATWRGFIETAQRLRAVLGRRLQTETGLSPGDYAVLLALREAAGNRMRSSALAEHIRVGNAVAYPTTSVA